MARLLIPRNKIESGYCVIVQGFELRLSLEGYYCISNLKTKQTLMLSNYNLMRRCLSDMIKHA